MLVTNNNATKILEQIIEISNEQITHFRTDLSNILNAFLVENKEIIVNDEDNEY